ncbi:MAG: hypothetical protein Q9M94_05700 [Candidatus Gracilibacteria bacterium]|nr:hypothetical protein [Candidatus Gracilibacteria bacterium]MDQ7022066.1 hypothetical protein [Candidatus Gracilibacteria bacterium]
MEKLEKLNSSELKIVLKGLKLYSDLSRKLGNRGKAIFGRELSGKKYYKVEYTSALNEEKVFIQAQNAFNKAFGIIPKKEDIVFIQNDTIFGGIKIFENDNMVDLSLSKAIDQIK